MADDVRQSKPKMTAKERLAQQRARAAKAAEAGRNTGFSAGRSTRQKVAGFVEFIREKGVVGLAIGLAIGTAASGLVAQVVNAVINPTVGLLVGEDGLASLNVTVNVFGRSADYKFGDLIDALITFVAIAAVIYFVVMGFRLDRLDKKKEE